MRSNNGLAPFVILTTLYSIAAVDSLKYLAVLQTPAKSHFIIGESLMKALAAKGHQVYVISPFPQKQPIKNYFDVPLKFEEYRRKSLFDEVRDSFFTNTYNFFRKGIERSENVLKDHNVQQLMATNITFDAVICEIYLSEPLYGLSEHFKAPLIGLSTLGALSSDTDMVGSPSPPSYVPNILLKITGSMTLKQRIINFIVVVAEKLYTDWYYLPRQANLYNKYFPNATRDMYTVRKSAAVVLLNTHVSYGYPRPYMPNHIEVGGLHINRESRPLPETMQKFIEEAKHGVVYFSMGSNLRGKDMAAGKRQEFLTAFANIKQRVLWKYEDFMLAGKPDNVLISDWFPQSDILAHKNVKIFVTHGGLLSITESIYHAIPIIGIPIFGDQFLNVEKAVADGFAVKLNYDTLTARDLTAAIKLLIRNATYTQRSEELSARYVDQPLPPRDLAVFWVEYVARHKGAKYMHCAGLDLNWFQYHNIDVIIILCGAMLTYTYTICYLFKCLCIGVGKCVWKKCVKTGKKYD